MMHGRSGTCLEGEDQIIFEHDSEGLIRHLDRKDADYVAQTGLNIGTIPSKLPASTATNVWVVFLTRLSRESEASLDEPFA